MRRIALIVLLIAATLPAVALGQNDRSEAEKAQSSATKQADDTANIRKAAQEATKAATPGAMRMAEWMKQRGLIHKDTVIHAPPRNR